MKQIIKILLFAFILLIIPLNIVHASAGFDGIYSVADADYTETCEPPIDLKSGFTVTNNKFQNLYGTDGDIDAAGRGEMTMYYSQGEYVKLVYIFRQINGINQADINWTSTSNSPEYHPNGCSGNYKATTGTFSFSFGGFDAGNFSGWFIIPAVIITVLCVGLIILIIIIRIVVRPAPVPAPAPEAAAVPQAAPPPVQTPAPVVQPITPAPASQQPVKELPRKKRPVYGKKFLPKKAVRIWPELTRRKP